MVSWLAIEATRGSANHLFQIATLVRAATALDARVDVLFRDAALVALRRGMLDQLPWSPAYDRVLSEVQARLRDADFVDLDQFLRDAKEHGDAVRYWACTETLRESGLAMDQLTPLIDGERLQGEFAQVTAAASARLRF